MDKELMDCLLSDEEISKALLGRYTSTNPTRPRQFVIAEAQLQSPKLKAYIDSQVQPLEIELAELKAGKIETIKALGQYCKGEVSDEKFAEIIGISLSELMDSF